ncbi:MAG: hypothetical protein JSS97_17340 [Actinobacteria bacterium]|nr:hypothetical protein [Actinomycetota bacterium]
MTHSSRTLLLAGALVLSLAIAVATAAAAAPGLPHVPGPIPPNNGKGRITKADIEFFEHWEKEADKADETYKQGVSALAKGCVVVKKGPAVARPPFQRAVKGFIPVAGKLEGLWEDLDTAAKALDQRSHAYSDAKLEFIVGSASDLLSHDFFERKMGVESGLKVAAENLAELNCSVAGPLADYEHERAAEQKDFPESIGHLRFALEHEP